LLLEEDLLEELDRLLLLLLTLLEDLTAGALLVLLERLMLDLFTGLLWVL